MPSASAIDAYMASVSGGGISSTSVPQKIEDDRARLPLQKALMQTQRLFDFICEDAIEHIDLILHLRPGEEPSCCLTVVPDFFFAFENGSKFREVLDFVPCE